MTSSPCENDQNRGATLNLAISNDVEMWFSILPRKVIPAGNFTSLEDLQTKITRCIDFFNKTMAKPFRWTYDGKPLAA